MEQKLSNFPQIKDAPVEKKIELIDELWEQVRRATSVVDVHPTHLKTLEQRLNAVEQEPSLALSPAESRALLKK